MDALRILEENYDRRITAIESMLLAENTRLRKDRDRLRNALDSCVRGLRAAVGARKTPAAPTPPLPQEFALSDVILPTHCACNTLLENQEQLKAHVARGCWRAQG